MTESQKAARRYRWLVVACAGLGVALVAMDISVNVSLPTITRDFNTDIQTIQWIIVAHQATRAALAVGAGSFGDLFGLRRVYIGGVVCYTVGVILIALSPSLAPIFGLRVLQGVGAGSLFAVAPAIAARAFQSGEQGTALGVVTAGFALGTMAGTLGAGYLVGVFGWEAAFLSRVPFCVVAILLGWLVLKGDGAAPESRYVDVPGAASLAAGMVALILALHMGGRLGWGSPLVIGCLVATPHLLALFVYIEMHARRPVLDLGLLRLPAFMAACSSTLFVHLGAFVIWYVFPFYVAEALGRGPLFLGFMLGAMAAAVALAGPVAGWASDRVHPKYVALAGIAAVSLGLLWMSRLDASSSTLEIALRIAIVGLGLGLFQSAAYTLALQALPSGLFGTGSGSLSLAQSTGSVVSVAIGGLIFALRMDQHSVGSTADLLTPGGAGIGAVVPAFQGVFLIASAVASIGMAALMVPIVATEAASSRRRKSSGP